MPADQAILDRPIRVVMFGSGPELNPDAQEFLCRLEQNPEIELLAAICQSPSQSLWAVFQDLWKRRGLLALPLFAARLGSKAVRLLLHPHREASLKSQLDAISDRILFAPDIHAREILAYVCFLEPDLGLIYGSPILKPELYEIPKLGTLGIHHGKLPEYRGNKTTFWAMYNGDSAVGVTIQKVNERLDTGSILKTGEVNAYHRLYLKVFHELEKLGIELYIQAILEVKHGTAEYRPQSGSKGKLYRNPKISDFLKFWWKQIERRLGFAR
jgi:folate-dependent phosphoribosylglycinamide formyltransferase PurN